MSEIDFLPIPILFLRMGEDLKNFNTIKSHPVLVKKIPVVLMKLLERSSSEFILIRTKNGDFLCMNEM